MTQEQTQKKDTTSAGNKLKPFHSHLNLWEVRLVGGGGTIPKVLQGHFTSKKDCQHAINNFYIARENKIVKGRRNKATSKLS